MNDGFGDEDDDVETIYIPQGVVDAVVELANSYSWEEKRALIEARAGELLGEYADLMVGILLAQYEQEPDFHDALTADRELLADCRVYSIAGAFARRARPERGRDLTPDVVRRLAATTDEEEVVRYLTTHLAVRRLVAEAAQSLVLASGPVAKRRVLERDRDLLLTAAAELSLRMAHGDDPDHQVHADLVAVARAEGIDAAIMWAYGELQEEDPTSGRHPEVEEILQELAYAEQYMPVERRLQLDHRGLELVGPESPEWAFFQWDIAQCLLNDRSRDRPARVEEAIERLNAALDAGRAAGRHAAVAEIRAQLSHAYLNRVRGDLNANWDEAVRQAELAVKEAPGDAPGLLVFVHTYAAQARLARSSAQDLVEGHTHARRALDLLGPDARPVERGAILQALGMIARAGGPDPDDDGGADHLRRAAAEFDASEAPLEWAAVMMELARAFLERGTTLAAEDAEEALTALREALVRTDAAGSPEQWARVHDLLAEVHLRRIHGDPADNIEQAIEHAEQALNVFTRDDFPDQWATATERLGTALRRRIGGNPVVNARRAIDHFTLLAAFHAAEGEHELWASMQEKIGTTHANHLAEPGVDHLALADEHLRRALKVYEEHGRTASVAQVRTNLLGIGWRRVWDGDHSEDLVREVEGHGEHALAWSAEHDDPDMAAAAHVGLGNLHHALAGHTPDDPHLAAARAHYEQALAQPPEAMRFDLLETRLILGRVIADQGNDEDALAADHALIADAEAYLAQTVTDAGRGVVLNHLGRAYEHASFLELRRGRYAEALRLLDRGRARLLLDAFATEPDPEALSEPEHAFVRRAEERVRRLRAELNSVPAPGRDSDAALGRQLALAQAELARVRALSSADAVTAEPWQLVPPDGVLVAPLLTFHGSALFVLPHGIEEVTSDHVLVLASDAWSEAMDMVVRWMSAGLDQDLERAPRSAWFEAVDEVTDRLWTAAAGPLHRRLRDLGVPDGTRLWITASILSHQLPLHAARRSEGGRHRMLLDDYVVTYTPSIQLLHQAHHRLARRPHDTRAALFLADSLGDLPYAAEEVATVKELFPVDRRLVLTGPDIGREAVLAAVAGRRYVHVACHAYLNWFQPNYSAIPLADGDYLTAGELAGLDLSEARLVTLSACQSGTSVSQHVPGEYSGLAASLLSAGAPTVVATLWQVDDHASSLLMSRFYEELSGDAGHDPARALRLAQLWLREATLAELTAYQAGRPGARAAARRWRLLGLRPQDRPYENPHYWGAYTVVGA
ncbi:CHAT domain-containing protein [Streptomyces sp. NPDC005728]|uniref:CHAT domain-containing protein n=1 Tax=Streptomyces sp. NPDC005728 TaxID=3157054 RepID=UPI0033E546AE